MTARQIKDFLKAGSGQGLIEVIVALAIGTALIAALVSLTVRSSRTSNSSRAENQASKLAEEGMERVVSILQTADPYGVLGPLLCPVGNNPCTFAAMIGNVQDSGCASPGCPSAAGVVYVNEVPAVLYYPSGTSPCPTNFCGGANCPTSTSNCLVQESPPNVAESLSLDTITYSREVFLSDSNFSTNSCAANPGPNLANLAVQVRVVVTWNDPSGQKSRQVTNCLVNT